MKRILSAALVIALLILSLASCLKNESDSVGNATLVIASEEPSTYDIPLSLIGEDGGFYEALLYLRDEKGLEFDETSGYLNSIGGLANDYEKGSYIYIYTSVESDFDVSEYKIEMEYEGVKLVSGGVGIYDMSLRDGAVIYIGTINW